MSDPKENWDEAKDWINAVLSEIEQIPVEGKASDAGAAPERPGMEKINFTTLIAIPCMDARMDCATVGGLMSVLAAGGGLIQPYFLMGNSNISEARNKIANFFMRKTTANALICVDSDIGFTLQDFMYLMEGPEELVIAPYAKKLLGAPPAEVGFGFVRINRSVFQKLDDWMLPDIQDPLGGLTEALPRYYDGGEVNVHYHFTGAMPDARWYGEDGGFFHWCALNQIVPRFEKRTRLVHYGRAPFHYPEQIPGWRAESDFMEPLNHIKK